MRPTPLLLPPSAIFTAPRLTTRHVDGRLALYPPLPEQESNNFTNIPDGTFSGLTSLKQLYLVRDAPHTALASTKRLLSHHPAPPHATSTAASLLLSSPSLSSMATSSRQSQLGPSAASRAWSFWLSCVMRPIPLSLPRSATPHSAPPRHTPRLKPSRSSHPPHP